MNWWRNLFGGERERLGGNSLEDWRKRRPTIVMDLDGNLLGYETHEDKPANSEPLERSEVTLDDLLGRSGQGQSTRRGREAISTLTRAAISDAHERYALQLMEQGDERSREIAEHGFQVLGHSGYAGTWEADYAASAPIQPNDEGADEGDEGEGGEE